LAIRSSADHRAWIHTLKIDVTRAEIDAHLILDAAARACEIFPERPARQQAGRHLDDLRSTTPYGQTAAAHRLPAKPERRIGPLYACVVAWAVRLPGGFLHVLLIDKGNHTVNDRRIERSGLHRRHPISKKCSHRPLSGGSRRRRSLVAVSPRYDQEVPMTLAFRRHLAGSIAAVIAFACVLALVLALAPGASAAAHHRRHVTHQGRVLDRSGVRDNSPDRATGPDDKSVDRTTGATDNSPDGTGATDNSPDRAGSQDKSSDSATDANDNSPDHSGSQDDNGSDQSGQDNSPDQTGTPTGAPAGSDNTPDTAAQRG